MSNRTSPTLSISLLMSIALELLEEAHGLREYGDVGAVSLERQAREVLAAALDLQAAWVEAYCMAELVEEARERGDLP